MASGNDWATRKNRVLDQFTSTLPTLITNYELKTRALDDLVQQNQRLEDEKGALRHKISMAEQNASTADREFLERKADLPDPFKPSKVATIQDVTFLLFFISIVLIINLFTYLVTLKNYQNILLGNLFYFILYLCALEIAPYYFMYYWFTKN